MERDVEGGNTLVEHITEQYNANADADEKGPHVATVRLDLRGAESRNTVIDEFVAAWREEVGTLADPISLVFKQPIMGRVGERLKFGCSTMNSRR